MKSKLLRLAFTAAVLATSLGANALVNKNVYAYDINVASSGRTTSPVVHYALNGNAAGVEILVFSNGNLVKTVAGTTNASNDVTVDLSGTNIPNGTISVQVKAYFSTVSEPKIVSESTIKFYSPWGLAVNNCTESATFGRLLVCESKYYASQNSSTVYHSSTANGGRGPMLYAFDPQLNAIANPAASNAHGFNAGINLNSGKYSNYSECFHTYSDVTYTDDGRLFLATSGVGSVWDGSSNPLYELDPDNLNSGGRPVLNSYSTMNHIFAIDAVGSGSNLKLIAIGHPDGYVSSSTTDNYNVCMYNLGTASTISGPSVTCKTPGTIDKATSSALNNEWRQKVAFDRDGKGYTISRPNNVAYQYRYYNGTTGNYISSSATSDKYTQAIAVNHDGTLMARQEGSDKVVVYACNNANGTQNLTKLYEFQPYSGRANTWICALEFDYADNLFVSSNGPERVDQWRIPRRNGANNTVVPAPSKWNYTLDRTPAISISKSYTEGQPSITINWSTTKYGETINKYEIYRNGTKIAEVSGSTTTYTDTPTSGTSCKYYVKAYYRSSSKTAQSGTTAATLVSVPTVSLTATKATNTTATLSWSNVYCNASKYYIYCNDVKIAEVSGSTSSYTDLMRNASNVYRVMGVTSTGSQIAVSNNSTALTLDINQVFTSAVPALEVSAETGDTEFRDDDLTRFSACMSWGRPVGYTSAPGANSYKLDYYTVELLYKEDESAAAQSVPLNTSNVTASFTKPDGTTMTPTVQNNSGRINVVDPAIFGTGNPVAFNVTYNNSDLRAGQYIFNITTVYSRDDDQVAYSNGTTAVAEASRDFSDVAMQPVTVRAFKSYNSDLSRIDIDFDEVISDYPVSYYSIEYRKVGEREFTPVADYWLVWGEDRLHYVADHGQSVRARVNRADSENGEFTGYNGRIPGNYNFWNPGGSNAPGEGATVNDLNTAKDFALGEDHEDGATWCVAYLYTEEDTSNLEIQVTAHLAASNEAIAASATASATPSSPVLTSEIDIEGATDSDIKIFPVPARTNITVSAPEAITSIEIYSANGTLVRREEGDSNNTMTISVADLAQGWYMVRVNDAKPIAIIKQ